MPTSTLVPLSEYLRTSYHPDRDWVDGEVRERNMGEGPHSVLQAFFIMFLGARRAEWGVRVLPEQRVQVSSNRFRIPDVCLVAQNGPFEVVVKIPPIVCIEILSWDDRMSDIQEKVEDYFAMGVKAVWVVDPRRRRAFYAGPEGSLQAETIALSVVGSSISVPVLEIFAELDDLEARS